MVEFARDQYQEILASAKSSKITLLFGPRQVGKTYILQRLHKQLKKSKYYNLEIPEHSRLFNGTEEEIFQLIKNSGDYVFIDEFYYLENISHIFKAIYDLGQIDSQKQIKIFASGSSAMAMHKHLKESMAGRFKKFLIGPLSYSEYSSAQDIDVNLQEYLIYGGLPGVYDLEENPEAIDKQRYLKQILQSYIQKDVKSLIQEENISAFNQLIYILADKQGQVVPRANLARDIRLSENTVQRYLDILEQTFVLHKLDSFAGNLSNELKKSKKYYFYDLGIRNAILADFTIKPRHSSKGAIWETFAYHYLLNIRNEANTNIFFWRTSEALEIDFIWMQNRIPTPIEVKSKLKKAQVLPALETFFKAYQNAPFGIVLNESLNEVVEYKGKEVFFISFDRIEEIEELLNNHGC